jgi:type VI secretion system secreted protein VgrG
MKRNTTSLAAHLALAAILLFLLPTTALAQTPPNVGAAQSFAVLGGSAVTAAGTGTVITGDVGVSPGTSLTGFPAGATVVPPFGTHVNDGPAIAAQTSTTALYTDLATRGGATPIVPELGGRTLTPGLYSFSSTANIASGTTLTLSGGGIYIFQVGSALTANVLSAVVLQNGASACDIFWQVTSAATLNGVTFAGTVVAQAAVGLGVGASLNGRALTTSAGAVTMDGGNLIGGGCSVAPPGCPAIAINPPTVPDGTTGTPYSQQFTGSGGTGPYTFTLVGGTLPAGLTLTAAGLLAGTPTTPGASTFTVRATDANGCFAQRPYTMTINAAVPTLPQFFVMLLALALTAAGYLRLRRSARAQ